MESGVVEEAEYLLVIALEGLIALEEVIEDVLVHDELEFEGGCDDVFLDSKGLKLEYMMMGEKTSPRMNKKPGGPRIICTTAPFPEA